MLRATRAGSRTMNSHDRTTAISGTATAPVARRLRRRARASARAVGCGRRCGAGPSAADAAARRPRLDGAPGRLALFVAAAAERDRRSCSASRRHTARAPSALPVRRTRKARDEPGSPRGRGSRPRRRRARWCSKMVARPAGDRRPAVRRARPRCGRSGRASRGCSVSRRKGVRSEARDLARPRAPRLFQVDTDAGRCGMELGAASTCSPWPPRTAAPTVRVDVEACLASRRREREILVPAGAEVARRGGAWARAPTLHRRPQGALSRPSTRSTRCLARDARRADAARVAIVHTKTLGRPPAAAALAHGRGNATVGRTAQSRPRARRSRRAPEGRPAGWTPPQRGGRGGGGGGGGARRPHRIPRTSRRHLVTGNPHRCGRSAVRPHPPPPPPIPARGDAEPIASVDPGARGTLVGARR